MTYVDDVLARSSDPTSPGLKARKTWESKSPEEQVFASRQVIHGAIAPVFSALAAGEPIPANVDPKQFENILGLLEATMTGYEQQSARQSRMGSQS